MVDGRRAARAGKKLVAVRACGLGLASARQDVRIWSGLWRRVTVFVWGEKDECRVVFNWVGRSFATLVGLSFGSASVRATPAGVCILSPPKLIYRPNCKKIEIQN
jgi:hypothetical protein